MRSRAGFDGARAVRVTNVNGRIVFRLDGSFPSRQGVSRDRTPVRKKRFGSLRILAFAAFLAITHTRATARDYFFDAVKGSDESEGTELCPLRSIARANALAVAPGDRLLFHSGQTFRGNLVVAGDGEGSPDSPIVIGSSGDGRAVIDAGLGTGVWVRNLGGVIIQDLTIVGAGAGKNCGSGARVENTLSASARLDFVRVQRVTCVGFGGYPGPVWDGYGGPSNYGEGIFIGGRPSDRSKSGYCDVRVEDCETYNNQYYGIYVSGAWNPSIEAYANSDVHVVNCKAHHNLGDPNYRTNHSGNGILLEEVDGGTIERCAAWENGALCACPIGGPVGIWAASANAIVIRECVSFANHTASLDGAGFDLDGGVSNSTIERCTSHDNDGAGILLYSYPGSPHRFAGNVVRDNFSANDGKKNHMAGIAIGSHGGIFEGVEIYRNTIYASSKAGSDRAVTVFGAQARGISFHHNLVVASDGARLLEAISQPGLSFSENAYDSADSAFSMVFDGAEYGSLAALRDGAGQETSEGDEARLRALAVLPADFDTWLQAAVAQVSEPDAAVGALAKKEPAQAGEETATKETKSPGSVMQILGVLLPPMLK